MAARALKFYSEMSLRRPFLTATVSTSSLAFIGDSICQYIDNSPVNKLNRRKLHRKTWDYDRSLRFGFVNIFIGPCIALWYRVLTRQLFPGYFRVMTPKTFNIAFKRMVVDQVCFAPIGISYVFTLTALVNGQTMSEAYTRIQGQMWTTLKANWSVWPAIILLNFWVVPYHYRVLTTNIVALGWNGYLSYMAHKSIKHKETKYDDQQKIFEQVLLERESLEQSIKGKASKDTGRDRERDRDMERERESVHLSKCNVMNNGFDWM